MDNIISLLTKERVVTPATTKRVVPVTARNEVDLPLTIDARFELSKQSPDSFTMLVFYRGKHCPICTRYLGELNEALPKLNELGGKHGVGRLDLVEGRYVGMKSRGIYETPGGTIMLEGHRGIESITLDRGAAHLKDELMPKYAELIYFGYWFSPEREMLQAMIDKSQEHVCGTVRLTLYKGSITCVGRWSDRSLYSEAHVTFEDDQGAYDQKDAAGFIKINALRLRLLAMRDKKLK